MTVKPLNLSILIGDMNRTSPPNSPRPQIKRSRIPLATSPQIQVPLGSPHGTRVTTFRQWADPPPPPPRSRTQERKSPTPKKRTGSADPRFRRTLATSKTVTTDKGDTSPLKQSCSVCELSTTPTIDSSVKNRDQNEFLPLTPKFDKYDNKDDTSDHPPHNPPHHPPIPVEGDMEFSTMKQLISTMRDSSPTRTVVTSETSYDEVEKPKVDEKLPLPPLKQEAETIKDSYNEELDARSESKYSQTDTDYNTMNDIEMIPEPSLNPDGDNTEIIHYVQSNYEKTSRYLDGIVLNRTRSISSIFEYGFESLNPCNSYPASARRKLGSISRIFLRQNYWTYVEMWVALSFLIAILLFGWFYLIPYLAELFSIWIYPRPPITASDYIRKSVSDIFGGCFSTIYNVLTTPANRRLI